MIVATHADMHILEYMHALHIAAAPGRAAPAGRVFCRRARGARHAISVSYDYYSFPVSASSSPDSPASPSPKSASSLSNSSSHAVRCALARCCEEDARFFAWLGAAGAPRCLTGKQTRGTVAGWRTARPGTRGALGDPARAPARAELGGRRRRAAAALPPLALLLLAPLLVLLLRGAPLRPCRRLGRLLACAATAPSG